MFKWFWTIFSLGAPDIICITQITRKFINNAWLTYNTIISLGLRSRNCQRTTLAAIWSFKGKLFWSCRDHLFSLAKVLLARFELYSQWTQLLSWTNLSTSVFLAQLQSMMLLNLHVLMTNAQTFVDDHRNTFTHSFRKRKMCTQSCIKYCLKTLPPRFLRRVQDWPIFMGFPRHTKPNWVWDQFYQPLELTTLT